MVAERRDLMVATYSSVRGTGERSTVSTWTGKARGAGCLASVLAQPLVNTARRPIARMAGISISFLNLFMRPFFANTDEEEMLGAFGEIQNHYRPSLVPEHRTSESTS